ncbi:TIR domain-containing protein [Amycolatopsis sp. cg5]|uniref:TIR domain-containing protein n=1 Tax=Amycolatopsis sp. cg5 TaxID=3238802 RepID=UPI0035240513
MARVYEYDVFISYPRAGATVPAWVRTHFYPRLKELLDDNLAETVSIFLDDEITIGGKWPQQVRDALQRTRVLVPVCSPKYFRDEWCLAEWYSMAEREKLAGLTSHGLIYPVIFSDSLNFPSWAHERTMRSFKDWNLPYPHFQNSLEYFDFHRAVESMAEDLVGLIERAPEWRSDWPVHTPMPDPPPVSKLPRF